MTTIRPRTLILLLSAGLLLAGCGSTRILGHTSSSASTSAAPSSAASVIRAWSTALRNGDVRAAAHYFALPSEFANGGVVTIHTEAQAILVNAELSCGSVVVSTHPDGRFTTAVFRLTNRKGPGGDCGSGAGALASTNFLIRGGKIVEWIRGPDPSSGAGTSTTPAIQPGSGSSV
jgi:limonene-1,2-epoxide hydrolase